MGAVIPAKILGLEGQVIKDVVFNEEAGRVRVEALPFVCPKARVPKRFADLVKPIGVPVEVEGA